MVSHPSCCWFASQPSIPLLNISHVHIGFSLWYFTNPLHGWLVVTGTREFYDFPIILGRFSSQLTFTPSFFRGVGEKPPTRWRCNHTVFFFGETLPSIVGGSPHWGGCIPMKEKTHTLISVSRNLANLFQKLLQLRRLEK